MENGKKIKHTPEEIQNHNAAIDAEIAELENQIKDKESQVEKYKLIIENANRMIGKIESTASTVLKTSSILENLIISGKSFDDGELNEICNEIKKWESSPGFAEIISVCEKKIKMLNIEIEGLEKQIHLLESERW